jgi:predicted dithiol-disulfide oxidoreductase (DUF899 family)
VIRRRRTPRFSDLVDRLEAGERLWATELSTGEKVLQQTLAEIFDGRSQLIVYHFMFGPPTRRAVRSARPGRTHTTAPCRI